MISRWRPKSPPPGLTASAFAAARPRALPASRRLALVSFRQLRQDSAGIACAPFALKGLGARSGEHSGDLQGLSNVQGADSESVDELLEQGNAFEAEVVKGVEDAGDADEGEVHTHEVPQDDVPGEYLDKNQ